MADRRRIHDEEPEMMPVRTKREFDDPLEGAARAYILACEGKHPDPDSALSNLVREAAKFRTT